MRRQEGSPRYQAWGLAIGVFIGCLPIFGLQMLVSLGLASTMRGNKFLAMAGTWISNPVTNLPLFWLSYQLGTLLLGPGRLACSSRISTPTIWPAWAVPSPFG